MKTFTLTQAAKQHDTNRLHDAFIAASLTPLYAESTATQSRFDFADAVTDPSINAVVSAYVFAAPAIPPGWVQLGQNYRNAVTNATTLAQCKAVLNGELWEIIKALAKSQINNL